MLPWICIRRREEYDCTECEVHTLSCLLDLLVNLFSLSISEVGFLVRGTGPYTLALYNTMRRRGCFPEKKGPSAQKIFFLYR